MKTIFTKYELKFLLAMGLVLGLREFSMTMLNPFVTIYGMTLKCSTIFLCGIAMGVYGLTNAFFQIPYGILSDKYGRKPVILLGLLQLSAGLALSGLTDNIYIFILSRALQGSGAVMAIAYAWIGDSITDSKKSRAMGLAGIIVALGAVSAFALGPILYKLISLKIVFFICSAAVFISLIFILAAIPENHTPLGSTVSENLSFMEVLKDRKVLLLSLCGFIYNYVQSEMFFTVPSGLDKLIGAANLWMVFVPAVITGIAVMLISVKKSDSGSFKSFGILAFLFLCSGSSVIALKSLPFLVLGSFLIISGFMVLTSGIPSNINKLIKKEGRGAANGILQTMTFFGFFVGPVLTGSMIGHTSIIVIQSIPSILSLAGAAAMCFL